MVAVWSLLLLCGAPAGCGGGEQRRVVIVVTPADGPLDRARSIAIRGLAPGALITVTARSQRPDGTWSASARFRTPGSGTVDLGRRAPLSGSYRGVSSMGLFWSQRLLSPGARPGSGAVVSTLTVSSGARALASTRVTQLITPSGVSAHAATLSAQQFDGEYFQSATARRRGPAVVVWGGSEGGLGDAAPRAALLAAHGISALALAYFDAPGLPCRLEDIPLEYFVRAIRWLRAQPQVDPDRVWIEASSRGSEAALLVAARWPSLVHGLIAAAPSAVVNGSNPGDCPPRTGAAWTLNGAPVPAGQPIAVQSIRGAVMLLTGGDDLLWPSRAYAQQIMSALPPDGAARVHLNYPAAGDAVLGIPFSPIPAPRLAYGGTIAADSAAYMSDWPASIAFVERS